jgi:hypothetical protein
MSEICCKVMLLPDLQCNNCGAHMTYAGPFFPGVTSALLHHPYPEIDDRTYPGCPFIGKNFEIAIPMVVGVER